MARTIRMRPQKYYARVAMYCRKRDVAAANDTARWFWQSTGMRFDLMKGHTGRIHRFKSCPWKFPNFRY